MLVLVGANLGLWPFNRIVGYTVKDHGAVFALIYGIDFFAFLGFALLGLLTAWLLAFRPETFKPKSNALSLKEIKTETLQG